MISNMFYRAKAKRMQVIKIFFRLLKSTSFSPHKKISKYLTENIQNPKFLTL